MKGRTHPQNPVDVSDLNLADLHRRQKDEAPQRAAAHAAKLLTRSWCWKALPPSEGALASFILQDDYLHGFPAHITYFCNGWISYYFSRVIDRDTASVLPAATGVENFLRMQGEILPGASIDRSVLADCRPSEAYEKIAKPAVVHMVPKRKKVVPDQGNAWLEAMRRTALHDMSRAISGRPSGDPGDPFHSFFRYQSNVALLEKMNAGDVTIDHNTWRLVSEAFFFLNRDRMFIYSKAGDQMIVRLRRTEGDEIWTDDMARGYAIRWAEHCRSGFGAIPSEDR